MIQELPCTLSLKEIKFLIQLEVLLVVTHLVDEYQTTAPAGMCREQYEQGLSNTIDSKDGAPVNIWWISWSEQAYWYFMPSPSSCPLPLSSQTMSRYEDLPSFYTSAVHALRSTTALQGSSLSILWLIHMHCMHHIFSCGRCVHVE